MFASIFDQLEAPSGYSKVEYCVDGTPCIENGQEYILFANSTEYNGKTCYYPIGNYQSRFEINADNIERYVPNDFNEEITQHDTTDFIEEIPSDE